MQNVTRRGPANRLNLRLSHTLASAAYESRKATDVASMETPTRLTQKQREVLERIIRVDQAGELYVCKSID